MKTIEQAHVDAVNATLGSGDGPGRYVEELARHDRELGIIKRNVWWTKKSQALSEEDRARVVLDMDWRIARGHTYPICSIDKGCPWWHVLHKISYIVTKFRVWRDTKLLKLDPYGVERDKLGRD